MYNREPGVNLCALKPDDCGSCKSGWFPQPANCGVEFICHSCAFHHHHENSHPACRSEETTTPPPTPSTTTRNLEKTTSFPRFKSTSSPRLYKPNSDSERTSSFPQSRPTSSPSRAASTSIVVASSLTSLGVIFIVGLIIVAIIIIKKWPKWFNKPTPIDDNKPRSSTSRTLSLRNRLPTAPPAYDELFEDVECVSLEPPSRVEP